ncbi:TnsD family Tn7-like transposition protein [Marinobacter shengliensis]|uniref:TnsD family Tn7-like transposition protein n=1 Tax=Marinobacter shengliensis TaxID=1389223 RepID=UPI002573489E|nr:TnsD family Tn7-like transposition protein [Marinobacter shengliensis]
MTCSIHIQPLPEETVYSLISRYHLLSGNANESASYSALYSSNRARINAYLPSQLQRTGHYFGLRPEALLWNHTLYPLFASFITPERAQELKRAMFLNFGSHVGEKAGLPQSKLKFTTGHKHCPVCLSEDLKQIGVGYFRNSHQLPGVNACPTHESQLFCTAISDFSLDRSLILPHSDVSPLPADNASVKLSRFGASVVQQLQIRQRFPDYRRAYRIQLNKKGLLTKNGNVRIRKVTPALKTHWATLEKTYAHQFECPHQLLTFEFVGPLLRAKTHYPTHPIKHLLFAEWLFDGDANFFWDADEEEQLILPGFGVPTVGNSHTHRDDFFSNRETRRRSICDYMDGHPFAIRKDIKAARNADFFWLYHNDRDWLEKQLPSPMPPRRPEKNWHALDDKVCEMVHEQTLQLSKPMSVSELDTLLGGHRWLTKFLGNLPKTHNLIEDQVAKGTLKKVGQSK